MTAAAVLELIGSLHTTVHQWNFIVYFMRELFDVAYSVNRIESLHSAAVVKSIYEFYLRCSFANLTVVCLSVFLSLWEQNNSKTYGWGDFHKFWRWVNREMRTGGVSYFFEGYRWS